MAVALITDDHKVREPPDRLSESYSVARGLEVVAAAGGWLAATIRPVNPEVSYRPVSAMCQLVAFDFEREGEHHLEAQDSEPSRSMRTAERISQRLDLGNLASQSPHRTPRPRATRKSLRLR